MQAERLGNVQQELQAVRAAVWGALPVNAAGPCQRWRQRPAKGQQLGAAAAGGRLPTVPMRGAQQIASCPVASCPHPSVVWRAAQQRRVRQAQAGAPLALGPLASPTYQPAEPGRGEQRVATSLCTHSRGVSSRRQAPQATGRAGLAHATTPVQQLPARSRPAEACGVAAPRRAPARSTPHLQSQRTCRAAWQRGQAAIKAWNGSERTGTHTAGVGQRTPRPHSNRSSSVNGAWAEAPEGLSKARLEKGASAAGPAVLRRKQPPRPAARRRAQPLPPPRAAAAAATGARSAGARW